MRRGICDRFFLGNLRWTNDGEVWASWRLSPLSRARTPGVAALVHAAHTALYRALPGRQVLLQGVLTWTDPTHIVDHFTEQVTAQQALSVPMPTNPRARVAAMDYLRRISSSELPGTRRSA